MGQLEIYDKRLEPATVGEITAQLHLLFASLPIKGGADPEMAVAGYVLALEGSPAWAVQEAVRRVLRGEAGDLSTQFCPRPPELAGVIKKVLAPVHADLTRRRDAERAREIGKRGPEPTAEERARVAATYERFKAGLPAAQPVKSALDGDFWERVNMPLRPPLRKPYAEGDDDALPVQGN